MTSRDSFMLNQPDIELTIIMKETVLTVGRLRSILARLPSTSPVYLSPDAEGNRYDPVLEIAYTRANAVILFPSDGDFDEEDLDAIYRSGDALLVYSAPTGTSS